MSGSDSDLDYESADEDAICDEKIKSNMHMVKHSDINNDISHDLDQKVSATAAISNDNLVIPSESQEIESSVEATNEKDSKVDILNVNNKQPQIEAVHDTNSNENVKELPSVKPCKGEKLSENTKIDKPVEDNIGGNATSKSAEDNQFKDPLNKVHEKQRVPLRLEKKLQQKQQLSKELSTESNINIPSEISSKKTEEKSSSWGFGSWGTSLLSTAASSVSTFTNQVSQGIGTVLETVESTLGAPPPEELAAAVLENKKELSSSSSNKDDEKDSAVDGAKDESTSEVKSSILPNVSSWTKVLEDTGSKVIMGGLDTLELIGKKTIDIITEGDPGLRKKRAVFADGITLSQILRQAKAEADESKNDDDSEKVETVHYSQMFDEYQGLVHLEALEMLSKQSEGKIQMLLMRIPRNSEIRKNLEEIKSICENIPQLDDPTDYEDFDDFLTLCKKYVLELNVTFNVENIIKTQKRINDVLENYENATATTSTPEEIYHTALCNLAEFTARAIEAFHKLAELILVQPTLEPNVEHFATNLTGLTTVMCIEINKLSSRYHHCLDAISEQCENGSSEKANITTVVTNLYLEAGNSNKYIQDAFMLLVPVLQASLLESVQ